MRGTLALVGMLILLSSSGCIQNDMNYTRPDAPKLKVK
jgi:hypothetical protein